MREYGVRKLKNDNEVLKSNNEVLKNEVEKLKDETKVLKDEIKVLKDEIKVLNDEIEKKNHFIKLMIDSNNDCFLNSYKLAVENRRLKEDAAKNSELSDYAKLKIKYFGSVAENGILNEDLTRLERKNESLRESLMKIIESFR